METYKVKKSAGENIATWAGTIFAIVLAALAALILLVLAIKGVIWALGL